MGTPVVLSWYRDGSTVLDLDGNPVPLISRTDASEMEETIGADGFSYTRKEEAEAGEEMPEWKRGEFKLGSQL